LATLLVACDRSGKPDDAAAPEKPPAASGSAAPRPAASGGESTAAVQQSPGKPLVTLAFVIEERPVVGHSFALKLLVSADAPLPALQLAVESDTLVAAPATGQLVIENAATPVPHDLVVTPQNEGLVELIVRFRADEQPETVYAVPVLVAAPAAAAPAG
jgi:hypothetical protein